MKFPAVIGALPLVALCLLLLSQTATANPPTPSVPRPTTLNPECESIDAALQTIEQSTQSDIYREQFGLDPLISCARNSECDGFSCNITLYQGGRFLLVVELYPCQDPPQMFLLIKDPDTETPYFEETITHGDSFSIPGLEYSYLGFIVLKVELRVQFQQVPGGLQIALTLAFVSAYHGFDREQPLFELPLLPTTVIKTPPCSTEDPSTSVQCIRMQSLVDNLHPPYGFTCHKNEDCEGFKCQGSIPVTDSSIPITADVTIDSCTRPVSMIITIYDEHDRQVWTYSFTQSASVPVAGPDLHLPPGVTANLNVTLEPYTLDIDYWITTIELTLCLSQLCVHEKFIDHGLVPIPPCDNPATNTVPGPAVSPTAMPGSSSECLTWEDVSIDIMTSGVFDENDMTCQTNQDCDGITCDMVVSSRHYKVDMKLFHCETPVRFRFKIDSTDQYGYHVARNITQENGNTPVQIDGIVQGGELKFYLAKRSDTNIELAILLRVPNPQNPQDIVNVPLVEDHIIPIKQCPATQIPVMRSVVATVPSSTRMKDTKPGPHSSKPGPNGNRNGPGKHQSARKSGVAIGVGIAAAAVVAIAVIIIAVLWLRRRSRSSTDHLQLVEDDSMVPI